MPLYEVVQHIVGTMATIVEAEDEDAAIEKSREYGYDDFDYDVVDFDVVDITPPNRETMTALEEAKWMMKGFEDEQE